MKVGGTSFLTEYATPTSEWEDWYCEYRFGAFYMFPPEPLRCRVNALRAFYDPHSQAICDAHISLTVPVSRRLTSVDAAEVAAILQEVQPFELIWGPPYQYPGIPGVVLRIEPVGTVAEIVRKLEQCACFTGAAPRRYPFSPHMTIAEFVTVERTEEILAELETEEWIGEFRCEEIAYAVPDAQFRFTDRVRWKFGGDADSRSDP